MNHHAAAPRKIAALLIAGLAGPVALLAARPFLQGILSLPSFCPFLYCVSRPCPSCGMTRALLDLLQGNFLSALRWHAFAPLLVILAGGLWAWRVLRMAAPKSFSKLPAWLLPRQGWLILLAAYLAYYLLRMAGACPVPDGYFP
ncbi:MAG: DUF2752 domain-containing protein [Lentisphaeria bacterium]|jgi:hypothetical protein|nr:DUF2752 domain-containing protein [Lentisphaeria bacterium]